MHREARAGAVVEVGRLHGVRERRLQCTCGLDHRARAVAAAADRGPVGEVLRSGQRTQRLLDFFGQAVHVTQRGRTHERVGARLPPEHRAFEVAADRRRSERVREVHRRFVAVAAFEREVAEEESRIAALLRSGEPVGEQS